MIRLRADQTINVIIAASPEAARQRQIDLVKTLQVASQQGKEKEVVEIFRAGTSDEDKQFLDSILEAPIFVTAPVQLENHAAAIEEVR